MIVELETLLACPPSKAIEEVKKARLLSYVARPVLKFVAKDPNEFPIQWEEGHYKTSIYLFGLIPLGRQVIGLTIPQSQSLFCMRDNGYSKVITKWDHTITIDPIDDGTLYKDRIVIEAGALTPIIGVFVRLFFRYRQKRWRNLVASNFDYV